MATDSLHVVIIDIIVSGSERDNPFTFLLERLLRNPVIAINKCLIKSIFSGSTWSVALIFW